MLKIPIDLQEGFSGDEVTFLAGGKKVYHAKDVTTKNQIGLAATFELEVSEGKTVLSVLIPSRHINETKEIRVTKDLHVAVSITEDNKLEWKSSDAPFYYM